MSCFLFCGEMWGFADWVVCSEEFQKKMSYWTRNTPLAAIRPEVDRKDLVDNAEIAGGRPVS